MRFLPGLFLFLLFACKTKTSENTTGNNGDSTAVSVKDPHTYAVPDSAVVKHLDLELSVDFEKQQLAGKAKWTISNAGKGEEIIFDANTLYIEKVTLGENEQETTYFLDSAKPFMGQALHIKILPTTTTVSIYYTTSNEATALQWLTPSQTAGKKYPFLFTQSQAILARTWIPCQDGPAIRFTYNATVVVPKQLMAVMSAENPQSKTPDGIYYFTQTHPIPSYLMALAIGDIGFRSIDNRTGVYAETVMLDKAAYEFADMGKMVNAAEKLYGPYRWGRFDVLVLPPGFPFGGMENPNLTFITPTLLAGDRSLVSVIAHELAHSWSGNLVTNATWNDMWLNEGFTTYFERRIIEELYGEKEAGMQEVLGRQDLAAIVAEKGDTSMDTRLKMQLAGRDPDDGITNIAYEKGYSLLRVMEEAAGREKFDAFLKSYFDRNAFRSRTTEQFLDELQRNLIGSDSALAQKIKAKDWIYLPGVPANAVPASSDNFGRIDQLLADWKKSGNTARLGKEIGSTNEKLYLLSHLPEDLNAGWVTNLSVSQGKDSVIPYVQSPMRALDSVFHFTGSNNAEVQSAWYQLAVRHQYSFAYPYIEKFLTSVGRRKLIVPIYKEMVKTPAGKAWAREVFERAKAGYHPLAVQTVGKLVE